MGAPSRWFEFWLFANCGLEKTARSSDRSDHGTRQRGHWHQERVLLSTPVHLPWLLATVSAIQPTFIELLLSAKRRVMWGVADGLAGTRE